MFFLHKFLLFCTTMTEQIFLVYITDKSIEISKGR